MTAFSRDNSSAVSFLGPLENFFLDALSMTTRRKEAFSKPTEEVVETTSELKRYLYQYIILGDLTFDFNYRVLQRPEC